MLISFFSLFYVTGECQSFYTEDEPSLKQLQLTECYNVSLKGILYSLIHLDSSSF